MTARDARGRPRVVCPSPSAPLLTLAEAAAALRVGKRTVEAWAASGRLPTLRLSPRVVRVHPQDLAAFLAALQVKA